MINKQAMTIFVLLGLSANTMADAFAEMEQETFNRRAHNELNLETGSCLPKLQESNERTAQMLEALKKRKNQISSLENTVENLRTKLANQPKPKSCDNSKLENQIAKLRSNNAELKSSNAKLKRSNNELKRNNDSLYASNEELSVQISSFKTQGKKASASEADLRSSQREVESLKQQISSLQLELRSAKANSAKPNAVKPAAAKQAQIALADREEEIQALKQKVASLESDLRLAQSQANAALGQSKTEASNAPVKRVSVAQIQTSSKQGVHRAKNLIDGDPGSFWKSANKTTAAHGLKLTLTREETVSRFYLTMPEYKYGFPPKTVNLYFSDGSTQTLTPANKWGKQRFQLNPVKTDYVEVEFGDMHKPSTDRYNSYLQFSEVELYGLK